jgi:hypothetical protein
LVTYFQDFNMSFQHNIPKATDLISVSQGDLLNNFTSMQTTYNTDHFGFDPVANLGFHKNVTLPGNVSVPAPAAGFGDMYGKTNSSSVTNPYWVSDGLAGSLQFAMMPIRAYGVFDGGTFALINGFNITCASWSALTGYVMNMPASVVSGTTYGVLTIAGQTGLNPAWAPVYQPPASATVFSVGFRSVSVPPTGAFQQVTQFTIIVLQV